MAHAKQLSSGAWRVQVYNRGGTPKYLSFTADTEDEANYLALDWKRSRDRKVRAGVTVGEAIDSYIAMNDGVLSPTTISNYKSIRRNNIQTLMDIPVKNLTQAMVQQAINTESKRVSQRTHRKLSPKTIANVHGLLSASIKSVDENFILKTTLPDNPKTIYEPLPASTIVNLVRGTAIELPVLLAAWLSFSMSEIRGIKVDAIKGDYLTIKESVVTVEREIVSKPSAKARERIRMQKVPEYIMNLIKRTEAYQEGVGYIVAATAASITSRWRRMLKKAGLPHMRFHDLRHLNASVMVALGVPDIYAMERGGWKTRSTLNKVYQHTLSEERKANDEKINAYFESLF